MQVFQSLGTTIWEVSAMHAVHTQGQILHVYMTQGKFGRRRSPYAQGDRVLLYSTSTRMIEHVQSRVSPSIRAQPPHVD